MGLGEKVNARAEEMVVEGERQRLDKKLDGASSIQEIRTALLEELVRLKKWGSILEKQKQENREYFEELEKKTKESGQKNQESTRQIIERLHTLVLRNPI
ncbi:hypothetical protein KAS79_00850 [Candidatus Parcubacteria bacterium]|nr:hypothetical protein [Candidatus Parcubacteria bacterium]